MYRSDRAPSQEVPSGPSESAQNDEPEDTVAGLTRRGVLRSAATLGIGASLVHIPTASASNSDAGKAQRPSEDAVPFYGEHQAGITTAAQEYLQFAAFDVTTHDVTSLRTLLQKWTAAAAQLTAGRELDQGPEHLNQAPKDTGETLGLTASQLTITVGFGPRLFNASGHDRFGLNHLQPPELEVLPPFPGEALHAASSGGDLCVQACSNDPQVAFHAVHVLARIASPVARLRWTQLGFGRTSSTRRSQSTPRNLMGFKDGTNNIRGEDTAATNQYVWVNPSDGPSWMTGGSYMVARRIKILFGSWDSTILAVQQRTIGRYKTTGAPLGGHKEHDPVNLKATHDGEPVIPENAHIRLASPSDNSGERILRRGYSYSEPVEPGAGKIDAGLFFIAYQRSPTRQFIPIQRRLAGHDALNRYTLHTSSAIFACPPGVAPGGFIGEGLFA